MNNQSEDEIAIHTLVSHPRCGRHHDAIQAVGYKLGIATADAENLVARLIDEKKVFPHRTARDVNDPADFAEFWWEVRPEDSYEP
jgi:hypothetical protein